MIFVDSNVPMYVVGADSSKKDLCELLVRSHLGRGEVLVTNAEVLQEILHRYRSLHRLDAIDAAFDFLISIVDTILPIEPADVLEAREQMREIPSLTARDAVHLAVMFRYGISRIMTRDTHFDGLPGVERVWGS